MVRWLSRSPEEIAELAGISVSALDVEEDILSINPHELEQEANPNAKTLH